MQLEKTNKLSETTVTVQIVTKLNMNEKKNSKVTEFFLALLLSFMHNLATIGTAAGVSTSF